MSDRPQRERIPLPPVLLSIVPFVGLWIGVGIAMLLVPASGVVGAVIGALVGFALPLVWIARRVRGDRR